ncbi:unnamed protein product [Camellia sinensis]
MWVVKRSIRNLCDSVTGFFSSGDHMPWCDPNTIAGCEREVAEAANGISDELKSERIMRFSWALVHSKQPEDVQRGIAMLEDPCQKLNNSSLADSLANSGSPLQKWEKLYLLAVGYYRSGEYRRSRQLAEQCLQIAPDWMQALTLKKTVDDQITKDGVIGIGITATVVGLVADKRCRNPHFAIINILFHDNKDITPKASNAAVAVGCEREVAEAANGVSDELKSERIMRLSWALVHSKQPEDMQRGIAMLEDPCQKLNDSSLADSLANSGSPLQKREKLYLLAVGYYRSEYRRSRQLAEQCLEIAPDWMQALTLKKTVDDQITKDGVIGIGITATVVGLVAGGIAASLARKN